MNDTVKSVLFGSLGIIGLSIVSALHAVLPLQDEYDLLSLVKYKTIGLVFSAMFAATSVWYGVRVLKETDGQRTTRRWLAFGTSIVSAFIAIISVYSIFT